VQRVNVGSVLTALPQPQKRTLAPELSNEDIAVDFADDYAASAPFLLARLVIVLQAATVNF